MDGYLFTNLGKNRKKFKFIREFLGCFRIHSKAKGSTINHISRKEWINLRNNMGIKMNENIEWSKQYRFQKFLSRLRRTIFYIYQGDFDYVFRKIKNKLHRE